MRVFNNLLYVYLYTYILDYIKYNYANLLRIFRFLRFVYHIITMHSMQIQKVTQLGYFLRITVIFNVLLFRLQPFLKVNLYVQCTLYRYLYDPITIFLKPFESSFIFYQFGLKRYTKRVIVCEVTYKYVLLDFNNRPSKIGLLHTYEVLLYIMRCAQF